MSGGFFYVLINGRKVCDYQYWAFASCAIGSLFNFKSYTYDNVTPRRPGDVSVTNYSVLEEHHAALFEWLKKHVPGKDGYNPQEYYMALSDGQVRQLPTMLKHECVKEVDHFLNKAHGPSRIHLFRISLMKDFSS